MRWGFLLPALAATAATAAEPDIAAQRQAMVETIQLATAATAPMTGVAEIDAKVADAFAKVPRHLFVPPPLAAFAYEDTPLPLGFGQNLAQPFIAALMTQLLDVQPGQSVFETGTDTGYQATVLSELGARVFTMEIVEPLFQVAQRLFLMQGHGGITARAGDGYYGWEENGPYDAIMVKESSFNVPAGLLRQLKPGGRMVIPLGPADGEQVLTLITKAPDGTVTRKAVLPVRFAPFQGGDRI